MLNGYEIAMLLMIAVSIVYMMWRLYCAIEQERREKQKHRNEQHAVKQEHGND